MRLQKGSRSSNRRHQKQQMAAEAAEYCKMQGKSRKISSIKAAGSAIGGGRGSEKVSRICKKAAEAAT